MRDFYIYIYIAQDWGLYRTAGIIKSNLIYNKNFRMSYDYGIFAVASGEMFMKFICNQGQF